MMLGSSAPAARVVHSRALSNRATSTSRAPPVPTRLRRSASGRCGNAAGRAVCTLQASKESSASAVAESREQNRASRLKKLFESLPASTDAAGGAGSAATYDALLRADRAWEALRNAPTGAAAGPPPEFVRSLPGKLPRAAQFDVVVAGGTLGIFYACALQLRGLRCAVAERGPLRGRQQEWNISRKELAELTHLGVLSAAECEACVASEFNPGRCGFNGGASVYVEDILNLGVSPDALLQCARRRFEAAGGKVFDETALSGMDVFEDGVRLNVTPGKKAAADGVEAEGITGRLVLDAMGNASPAVRQVRWGERPDGVCMVVGSCARGFPEEGNKGGDIIVTAQDISEDLKTQLFWEAFPAGSGPTDRTTYLFTYLDAHPSRPSLETMMDSYLDLLPAYQGVPVDRLAFQRLLFGVFPTYRASPLRMPVARLLPVGDASGIQSPLSFGGFGAVCRHLGRIADAVQEALEADALDAKALGAVNAYQPNLSGAWMFQRAMSVPVGSRPSPTFINSLLSENFSNMERAGPAVLRPFLQDVVQFAPLARSLAMTMVSRPSLIPRILVHVGPAAIADWVVHFALLGLYTLAATAVSPVLASMLREGGALSGLSKRQRFLLRRQMDAWKYGAGLDYTL